MTDKAIEQRLKELEKRVAILEEAQQAKITDPAIGVYYRRGKPLKDKPRDIGKTA